jgi:hypothetical protein
VPVRVTGEPDTVNSLGAARPTEVTLPVLAQVPSPRQKVVELAPVPLLRFVTGRFPVTSALDRLMAPAEKVPDETWRIPVDELKFCPVPPPEGESNPHDGEVPVPPEMRAKEVEALGGKTLSAFPVPDKTIPLLFGDGRVVFPDAVPVTFPVRGPINPPDAVTTPANVGVFNGAYLPVICGRLITSERVSLFVTPLK